MSHPNNLSELINALLMHANVALHRWKEHLPMGDDVEKREWESLKAILEECGMCGMNVEE